MLNISCNLLTPILKAENRMVVSVSAVTLIVTGLSGQGSHRDPASQQTVLAHTSSWGKKTKSEILRMASTECLSPLHHRRVENCLNQTIVKDCLYTGYGLLKVNYFIIKLF